MPLEIDIRDNTREVDRQLGRLSRELRDKAMIRALNRGLQRGRTEARRAVVKDTGLAARDVLREIHFSRAHGRKLFASLVFHGKRLNLIKFKARETRKGVSAVPWKKRRVFHGTFKAPARSGGEKVFKRQGPQRLPIVEVYGPGIANSFRKIGRPIAQKVGIEAAVKEYRRQVELLQRRILR